MAQARAPVHNGRGTAAAQENLDMIRYMGTHTNANGETVYAFLVNGVSRELREEALTTVPGYYESLPAPVQAEIEARRRARTH
jgi:hypothetical protein